MSLDSLSRSLQETQSTLNFFDHAYRELSHEAVLAYSFDAFNRRNDNNQDPSAAQFADEILRRCFSRLDPPPNPAEVEAERQHAPKTESSLRPDFVVSVSRNGTTHHAVIETKLSAAANEDQLNKYHNLLQTEHDETTLSTVALYKSIPHFSTIEFESVTPLTMDTIHECLDAANAKASSSWLIDQYHQWVKGQALRENLLSHPEFQEWYVTDGEDPPDEYEQYENVWPTHPNYRRRVHWHLLHRLAETLDKRNPHIKSEPNVGDDTAWVHLRLATLENSDSGGSLFYRLDTIGGGHEALDLRLYAGPKRGKDGDNKSAWIDLKKRMRASLRDYLAASDLGEQVDTPGRQKYRFEKSSKETSLCRMWLGNHEKGLTPSELTELFPEIHAAAVAALQSDDEMTRLIGDGWDLPVR